MYAPSPPLSLKRWEALAGPGHSDDNSLTVRSLLTCAQLTFNLTSPPPMFDGERSSGSLMNVIRNVVACTSPHGLQLLFPP